MIETPQQLAQAREAVVRVETALRALRERIYESHPALFEVMAQDYVATIRTIRADIDEYIGLAAIGDSEAPLWLVLSGERLQGRDISSRLLSDWLGRLRKAVHNVAVFLEQGVVRTSGRPDQEILSSTDLHVLAVQPGSIRIGLRPPAAHVQEDLFSDDSEGASVATRAIERLLRMAMWAASNDDTPPLSHFPNRDETLVVAKQLSSLAPSPRGEVQLVTFSGAMVPSPTPIRMLLDARTRLRGLEQLLSHAEETTVYGVVREIDLDAKRVILRERGPGLSDVRCHLPPDLVEEAEHLINRNVAVTGIISTATPDHIDVRSIRPSDG